MYNRKKSKFKTLTSSVANYDLKTETDYFAPLTVSKTERKETFTDVALAIGNQDKYHRECYRTTIMTNVLCAILQSTVQPLLYI